MLRRIGFLIFPDFQILDATGPLAAFEMAGRYVPGSYELSVVAAEPGAVRSSCGAAMIAEPLRAASRIDTLVVAGGVGTAGAMQDRRLQRFVRRAAAKSRRIASVCSGAYVLAACGLLDGRRATTHWNRSPEFQRRFPAVKLEPDRIFVRDGAIWTSAGITAGIDLSLALIAQDLGEDVAKKCAQQLVVYHRRPGGQSQFSALLEVDRPDGRFGTLVGWMRENLHTDLGVERLAAQAAMSPRNFARAFLAETGVTPARAVERLRVECARERIEAGPETIDRIALAAGFNDAERMRRAFLRAFGQPPQALRRAARA